jgi:hypothetical protein
LLGYGLEGRYMNLGGVIIKMVVGELDERNN